MCEKCKAKFEAMPPKEKVDIQNLTKKILMMAILSDLSMNPIVLSVMGRVESAMGPEIATELLASSLVMASDQLKREWSKFYKSKFCSTKDVDAKADDIIRRASES